MFGSEITMTFGNRLDAETLFENLQMFFELSDFRDKFIDVVLL